jgi:ribonuclease J
MISLTVYDGANGIGGNKIYLEENAKGVFLDFGKNFGKYGIFYEEFLKNRDTRGIHDLMYLDLLPKLNIYRPDLIPSDLSMSQYLRSTWPQFFLAMPTWTTAATLARFIRTSR